MNIVLERLLGFFGARDSHCNAAALLFLLGNFLSFVYWIALPRQIKRIEQNYNATTGDLEVTQLIGVWIARMDLQGLLTTAVLINAFAWVLFAIVVLKMTWVLSSNGRHRLGSSITIAVLAIGGSLGEFLSSLLFIGMQRSMTQIIFLYELNTWLNLSGSGFQPGAASDQPNTDFNGPIDDPTTNGNFTESGNDAIVNGTGRFLKEVDNFDLDEYDQNDGEYFVDGDSSSNYDADGVGWKSLELIHTVSVGFLSFIDATEYLIISAILFLTFVAIWRKGEGVFSMSWAVLGLLLSLTSMAQFVADVLSESSYAAYITSVGLVFINQVLLLPIWIFWLGRQLKELKTAPTEEERLAMT